MSKIDVNLSTYIDFNKENDKEDLKFKVNDYVRISKFAFQIGVKNFSRLKKLKSTEPWTYVIQDLNVKKLLERFMKKNCKKKK